jgi:hypothetical protein
MPYPVAMECAMAQMIRKQIYLTRKQQTLLARLTAVRGISESEVIRQAIEHEAANGFTEDAGPDAGILDLLIQLALSRRSTGVTGEPLRWSREDVYAERVNRYGRQAE